MGDRPNLAGPSKAETATKGICEFNEKQASETNAGEKATVSLYQFDTVHDTVWDFLDLRMAPVRSYVVKPRGGTALYDATGFAITKTGEALAAMPEEKRPGKVFFVITTDGLNNSSTEYKLKQVKEMITRQQDVYGWHFAFLGADIDAFAAGDSMGISHAGSLSNSGAKYDIAYAATSDVVTRTRGGGSFAYTDEERSKSK